MGIPGQFSEKIFISNIEETLAPQQHVTGEMAAKVGEISERYVFALAGGEYSAVVLPSRPDRPDPDPEYLAYVSQFGELPEIIIPQGVNPDHLSIRDGFDDPLFQEAVRGRFVSSYNSDPQLNDFVTKHGGQYEGGDQGEAVAAVNSKTNYARLAEGVVNVVEGEAVQGADSIASAVLSGLKKGSVFVRLDRAGGGLGNRQFHPWEGLSIDEVIDRLNGDQAKLWQDGVALVEPFMSFTSSPGVTFNAPGGFMFDNRQINQDSNCVGVWSPVPEWEVPAGRLAEIGDRFATRVEAEGYTGQANTDLGIIDDGEIYGFEINGRKTAAWHPVRIGELLLGKWRNWAAEGYAIKSIDKTYLRQPASFTELRDTLAEEGLLATPDNPFGAVITIPPTRDIAGIQVQGRGYQATETLHRRVLEVVGHPTKNREDHPLLGPDMRPLGNSAIRANMSMARS